MLRDENTHLGGKGRTTFRDAALGVVDDIEELLRVLHVVRLMADEIQVCDIVKDLNDLRRECVAL